MGWFWAAPSPSSSILPPQHPPLSQDASPPPGCPMHTPDTKSTPFPPHKTETSDSSSCPVRSPNHPLRKITQQPPSPDSPSTTPTRSKYNPLNYIPTGLTNTASSSQTYTLPLDRENSSIPRPDTASTWEYPSPQQMYNAMLRKGYTDTDVTAVESMVAVHNFLNEGAWSEILEWESIFAPGLSHAWNICRKGEAGIAQERARKEFAKARREALGMEKSKPKQGEKQQEAEDGEPKLIRFQGFPQKRTPKAQILSLLGNAFPSHFSSDPPFDRHDWYVERRSPNGSSKEVRYVIDYYAGGEEGDGQQVFYLDIRPALDTPTAVAERAMRWSGDVWWKASGGVVREKKKQ